MKEKKNERSICKVCMYLLLLPNNGVYRRQFGSPEDDAQRVHVKKKKKKGNLPYDLF